MSSLVGDWILESQENIEKYMQESGVPDEAIKKLLTLRPTISLTQSGDEFTLIRKNTLRGDRPPIKFKHMQEIHAKSKENIFFVQILVY